MSAASRRQVSCVVSVVLVLDLVEHQRIYGNAPEEEGIYAPDGGGRLHAGDRARELVVCAVRGASAALPWLMVVDGSEAS